MLTSTCRSAFIIHQMLPDAGFASCRRYVPAGSVMPGTWTGALNVRIDVLCSVDCANAPPAAAAMQAAVIVAEMNRVMASPRWRRTLHPPYPGAHNGP